jgi:hypothetical protein
MTKDMKKRAARLLAATAINLIILPQVANAYDAAAAAAAANGQDCSSITPFYWEIGTATSGNTPLASGSVNGLTGTVTRSTVFNIASASKWIFGAYVFEREGGVPSNSTIKDGLRMETGYIHYNQTLCTLSQSVSGCFSVAHIPYANYGHDSSADGSFYYSGGNDQYLAATASLLNIGGDSKTQLTTEVNNYLNLGPSTSYQYPSIPGGMQSSAADYAAFLQKLMIAHSAGGYVLADYLGADAVPTQPCAVSGCNPAGTVAMHYSYNHWVEDNTAGGTMSDGTVLGPGDGAFSSIGAYGFYPWISADKQYYGILSRRGATSLAVGQSVKCGQEIRAAFLGE